MRSKPTNYSQNRQEMVRFFVFVVVVVVVVVLLISFFFGGGGGFSYIFVFDCFESASQIANGKRSRRSAAR